MLTMIQDSEYSVHYLESEKTSGMCTAFFQKILATKKTEALFDVHQKHG